MVSHKDATVLLQGLCECCKAEYPRAFSLYKYIEGKLVVSFTFNSLRFLQLQCLLLCHGVTPEHPAAANPYLPQPTSLISPFKVFVFLAIATEEIKSFISRPSSNMEASFWISSSKSFSLYCFLCFPAKISLLWQNTAICKIYQARYIFVCRYLRMPYAHPWLCHGLRLCQTSRHAEPCFICLVRWLWFFPFWFSVAQLKSCSVAHIHKLG